MNRNKKIVTRRTFLKKATTMTSSVIAMPYVITSAALGNKKVPPASERITLGHIGVGGQGNWVLSGFLNLPNSQSVAVCDPFETRQNSTVARIEHSYANRKTDGKYKGCARYGDFRELLARDDIDGVVIATPDHWHVPIAVAAVRAGKDIYVEKPLGLSINQNKILRKTIARYGSVFQYGTHQRCFHTHCAFGCELVRNGRIGPIKEIHVVAPGGNDGGSMEPAAIPDGFDYDMWLGPAPHTPYTEDRCSSSGSYFVYDNSIGFIAGWGAHPLDIMHWGYPQIPVEYEGTGEIPTVGLYDAITKWNIQGRFADGVKFSFKDGPDKTTFIGEEGWVAISRAGIDAHPKSLLTTRIRPDEIHLLQNNNHYQDFVDGIRTRKTPVSNIESAVQSDFISHLSDIAIRTGNNIKWDPAKEEIIGNPLASRMMNRPMRNPWRL